MRLRNSLLLLMLLLGSHLMAQKSGCNLMTDRDTDEGHLKSTRRASLIDQPNQALGAILQNYSGNLKMLVDWAVNAKKITAKPMKDTVCVITVVLNNGQQIALKIKEPGKGSGARLQSWGNYELGGMVNLTKGQADTLLQAPIKSLLLSFYGLPSDTVTALVDKNYFIKTIPCVR